MHRVELNPDGTTTRVTGRRNSRPTPASPRAEFQHRPRKSLEPITHREVGASMAHRGEAPARSSPVAAAHARRSALDDEASMRLLLELQQRHRSMLQALVAQQALMPASSDRDPVHAPGLGAGLETRGAFPRRGEARSPMVETAPPREPSLAKSPRQPPTGVSSGTPRPDLSSAAGLSTGTSNTRSSFAVFRSRNVSVPVSEYDARIDGALHVARELDVDPEGRTLVGVESGPHKELRVALDRLCSAPRYGALGMADELILLTQDARLFRDDALAVKAPDGAVRFLILHESYQRAVAAHGSWVVDRDVVEDVLTDVVDEAAKARSAPETERKEMLKAFAGGSDFNKPFSGGQKKRKREEKKESEKAVGRATREAFAREENTHVEAARKQVATPLLESRPARDAEPRSPEEKSAPALSARETPLVAAATASSGSESSEGSETSTSENSDSETSSRGGEGDRAVRSRRRREAVERAVAEAQRARLKKAAASGSPPETPTKKNHGEANGEVVVEDVKKDGKDVKDVVAGAAAAAADVVANDDSDSESDSDVPFLDVDVVAADGSAPHALDAAASRRKSQPPRLEEFHALRGLVLGSVADSLAAPQKKPPPASTVQFQLATPENRFHVLAARCDARSDEGDFGIRVGAGGLVYVHKRAGRTNGSTDSFEFVARFPEPVDEDSAQSVVKEGVLFVVCEPEGGG